MRKLVSIAGLYMYYDDADDAFRHQLTDTRARVISEAEVAPTHSVGELRVEDVDRKVAAGELKGFDLFALAALHFWKHGIAFDYFDIGSNVGLNAVALAVFFRRCGQTQSRVHAFEPGDIYELLSANVRINGLADQVVANRMALSDFRGTAEFFLTPQQSPAGSLLEAAGTRPGIVETRKTTVNVDTLGGYLASIGYSKPGLLAKIDTEGNDYRVMLGMPGLLERPHTVLQIEFFPSILKSYVAPDQLLGGLGRFHMINCGSGGKFVIENDPGRIRDYIGMVEAFEIPASDVFLIPRDLPDAGELVARVLAN